MIIKLFKIKHKITGYLTEENGKYMRNLLQLKENSNGNVVKNTKHYGME